MLRDQIVSFILPICGGGEDCRSPFTAEFVAEALIAWSVENADFELLYPLLEKAIKK
jgi:hypothetical protein